MFQPACSLIPLKGPFTPKASTRAVTGPSRSGCFRLEQQLPGGLPSAHWILAPFSRRTPKSSLAEKRAIGIEALMHGGSHQTGVFQQNQTLQHFLPKTGIELAVLPFALVLQDAFHHPIRTGQGDRDGTSRNPSAHQGRPASKVPQHRKDDGRDRELAKLHAKVKPDQRHGNPEGTRVDSTFSKRIGEAEPMHQPERKRNQASP